MLKELLKGSVIYGISPFVPRIVSVILLPIMTRYLTSTDYGIIGTITTVTLSIQAFQDLGLRTLLQNYFYKCPYQYKVIWREIYGFLSVWMVLFAIIQSILLFFLIPVEAIQNRWLIIVFTNVSTVLFGPTSIIGQMYYQLNLRPEPVAMRLVVSGILTIIINFICVVILRLGYMGAYIGAFGGTFLINLSYWPVVNRQLGFSPIYNFKLRTIRKLLKVSIPTIPHYYSSFLMNSSNVMVMNYYKKPITDVGYLTMARNISGMFESILNAINQAWSPLAYQNMSQKNGREMKRILQAYILSSYTLTILYSLWSKELYTMLISNEEIANTYKYSIILVMALNYRPLYVHCVNYFIYYEHTIQLLRISFMSGILSFFVYFLMIPQWGIWAALGGYYLGCLYMGYSGYLFRFYKKHTIINIRWYVYMLLQILATYLVYRLVDSTIIVKVASTLVFTITIVVILKYADKDDKFGKKGLSLF